MTSFRSRLTPVLLAGLLAACSPSTPDQPTSVPEPVAPTPASALVPVAPAAVEPAVQTSAPTAEEPVFDPLPEIALPEGARLDTENSPQANRAIYEALKIPGALRFVYGAGERRIVVFSDPGSLFDLEFFQMLEANADNLNATVTLLPYAPASRTASRAKLHRLWCAQSQERTWRTWMTAAAANTTSVFQGEGSIPEAAWLGWSSHTPSGDACSSKQLASLDQIRSLGDRLGVVSTPTVVFAHGEAWPGPMVGRDDLEKVWWYVYGHLKVEN